MAEEVEASIRIPLLHIVDATAERIKKEGKSCVGLLGTRFTMEQDFYKDRLKRKHGIEVFIPPENDRKSIHGILYGELCFGEIKKESKDKFREVIGNLEARGAEGVILGCTEIPLIVKQKDYSIRLYDTTDLHARAAVDFALR